jgi:hypothetical protein
MLGILLPWSIGQLRGLVNHRAAKQPAGSPDSVNFSRRWTHFEERPIAHRFTAPTRRELRTLSPIALAV